MALATALQGEDVKQHPRYQSMFGRNWKNIENRVIGGRWLWPHGIEPINPGFKKKEYKRLGQGEYPPIEILFSMFDLNPQVFGLEGNLRQCLEAFSQQSPAESPDRVRIMSAYDTNDTFTKRADSRIYVKVDPSLEDKYHPWQDGEETHIRTHEMVVAVNHRLQKGFIAFHHPARGGSDYTLFFNNADYDKSCDWLEHLKHIFSQI